MQMNGGRLMPVKELVDLLRQVGVSEEHLETIGTLPPTVPGAPQDVLQVCIKAGTSFRPFKCGVNHVAGWKTIPKDVSARRAATWEGRLKDRINEGRVEAW